MATSPSQEERERSNIFLLKVGKHPVLFYVNFTFEKSVLFCPLILFFRVEIRITKCESQH